MVSQMVQIMAQDALGDINHKTAKRTIGKLPKIQPVARASDVIALIFHA